MKRELYLWNDEEKWNEELNEAWANLGEHGFDKEATYVSRDADGEGHHWLITIEVRDGWDGMEPHYRVGYWNAVHESASKFAGQWLTHKAQQKKIDWDWTCNHAKLYEMEYKTWDDLLNDNGFRPLEVQDKEKMNMIADENRYLEGYRQAWHSLWQELTTVGDGLISGEDAIKMMERIEENKLQPLEKEE